MTRRAPEAPTPRPIGGKNVDVVALRDGDGSVPALHRRERRAGGDQRAAIGPAQEILRRRFALLGGIGERKDDGPVRFARHFPHDRFGERPAGGGKADQDGRAGLSDDIGQLPGLASG